MARVVRWPVLPVLVLALACSNAPQSAATAQQPAAQPTSAPAQPADPLPSWNDGAAKKAILDFVRRVTQQGGPDFVPPAERIATFDNDGTLWSEKPMYVPGHVCVRSGQGARAAASGVEDAAAIRVAARGRHGGCGGRRRKRACSRVIAATHTGMTTDEFSQTVQDWIATAKHPRTGRLFTEHGLSADAGTARLPARATASRRSSCPAAGSSSCGRGPSASTASRPSR